MQTEKLLVETDRPDTKCPQSSGPASTTRTESLTVETGEGMVEEMAERDGGENTTNNVIEVNPFCNLHPNPSGVGGRLSNEKSIDQTLFDGLKARVSDSISNRHSEVRRDFSCGYWRCKANGTFCVEK